MQGYASAPARNQSRAANASGAAKPGKVSAAGATPVTASNTGNQGNGHTPGAGIKGFSGSGTLPAKC